MPGASTSAQVLEQKLRAVNQVLPLALILNLIISGCLALVPGFHHHRLGMLAWFGGNILVGGFRYASTLGYSQQSTPEGHPLGRCRRLQWGALAQGLAWGAAGLFLFPSGSLNQVFLLALLFGMTGGAIAFLTPVWSAYLLFLVPALLPISIRLLLEPILVQRIAGAMSLLYILAMVLVSGLACRWVEASLLATLDKEALAEDLLEANAALREYRAALETTVSRRTQELSETNDRLEAEIEAKEEERVRAAQAEARYRNLFDSMSEGFAHLDAQDRFLLANPAGERIFGVAPGDLVLRSLQEFLPVEALDQVAQESVKRSRGDSSSYFHEILRPDGERRWLQVRTSPLRDNDQHYAGTSMVFQDVTEQKLNEEALRHAQKLESLGLLAGGIAHDFNNLLSAIMGNLNLVQLDTAPGSPTMGFLANIEAATNRAADLTRQMLAYSGRGRFLVSDLDLNQVITELTALLQVGIPKPVNLCFQLAPQLAAVAADPAQLQQILVSLVTNAGEALEDQPGEIQVSTRMVDLDAPAAARISKVLPVSPGPHVQLEVLDTGCGMDSAMLPFIFDPFFTTKASGRGLGLSAILGILKGHAAGIEVQSRARAGSSFRLFFPLATPIPEPLAPPPAQAPRPFAGQVLLVDDEPSILETGTIMLQRMGFQVITGRDGVEAVAAFRAHSQQIGLVLLDLTMPRMDGHQAFLAIRGQCPDLPMILSSGYDALQTLPRFPGPGAPLFLPKPYTLKMMRKTIELALAARGQTIAL